MKSIKPGRGQSAGNLVGSIIGIIFGIFWTATAFSMTGGIGGPAGFFPFFGILFIIAGVVNAVIAYKNMTGKDRFSIYDITEDNEEGDPFDKFIKGDKSINEDNKDLGEETAGFCPYCGHPFEKGHVFCKNCGKKLD